MPSKSKALTKQLRYQKWINEVQDCHNRPADMSVEEWCEINGLKYSTYYRHHLMVKELAVSQYEEQLPAVTVAQPVATVSEPITSFLELKAPTKAECNGVVSITCGNLSISLQEEVSEAFMVKLFGALSHVK